MGAIIAAWIIFVGKGTSDVFPPPALYVYFYTILNQFSCDNYSDFVLNSQKTQVSYHAPQCLNSVWKKTFYDSCFSSIKGFT